MDVKKAAMVFTVLLLLAVPVLAQLEPAAITTGDLWWAGDPRSALLIQGLVLGMGVIIAGISLLYMLAPILKQSELQGKLKEETWQLIITVVWGIGIFGAAMILNGIFMAYTHNSDTFTLVDNYLSRVNCLSLTSVVKLQGMKMGADYLSHLKGKYYAGAWGFKAPIMPGFEVIERAIDLVQSLITPFSASIMVQEIGLQIIKATALTFILPAGLLLRLFPNTREAGSFLMAVAFAFYFVFTFIYLINAQVMGQLYQQHWGHAMCDGDASYGGEWLKSFSFYNNVAGQTAPIAAGDITSTLTYNPMALLDPIEGLSYVVIQSVFLPAMTMTLVISFIKSTTKFFSQNVG